MELFQYWDYDEVERPMRFEVYIDNLGAATAWTSTDTVSMLGFTLEWNYTLKCILWAASTTEAINKAKAFRAELFQQANGKSFPRRVE